MKLLDSLKRSPAYLKIAIITITGLVYGAVVGSIWHSQWTFVVIFLSSMLGGTFAWFYLMESNQ